ncbi:MAG: hypothetical protein AAF462_05170 [Thermodesulfobacteriota bacterium]
MSQGSNWELDERVDAVFKTVVIPAFQTLIDDYDQVGGYEVKEVSDSPIIMGIEKYSSIMVKHPGGQEMIVCVYWVKNSERLIAENIQMVTLNKSFNLFTVTKEELSSELKFLTAMSS